MLICNLVELTLIFPALLTLHVQLGKKQKPSACLLSLFLLTNRLLFACLSACLALALPATRGSV